jgi:hypothetical protein
MSRCRCASHMHASRSAAVEAVVQAPVARRGVVRTDLLAAIEPGQGPDGLVRKRRAMQGAGDLSDLDLVGGKYTGSNQPTMTALCLPLDRYFTRVEEIKRYLDRSGLNLDGLEAQTWIGLHRRVVASAQRLLSECRMSRGRMLR